MESAEDEVEMLKERGRWRRNRDEDGILKEALTNAITSSTSRSLKRPVEQNAKIYSLKCFQSRRVGDFEAIFAELEERKGSRKYGKS